MQIKPNPVDALVVGGPVLEISGLSSTDDVLQAEREWLAREKPRLVVGKVKAEDLALIHLLEAQGFRTVECQLQLKLRLACRRRAPEAEYEYVRVQSEPELDAVLGLAGSVFIHDRFTMDPALGRNRSAARYQAYVRQSFARPDEEVLALRNRQTGALTAFSTQRRISPKEVQALLGGVAPEYQGTGIALIHDEFIHNHNFDQGVRVMHSAISAINYPILHLHLLHTGYRVVQAWLVLRKIYD